jgi:hypothetical protein
MNSSDKATALGKKIIFKLYHDLDQGAQEFKQKQLKISSNDFLTSVELIQAMLCGKRPALLHLTEAVSHSSDKGILRLS